MIQLGLKTATIDRRLLETIDKAFGIPMIFELHYQHRRKKDPHQWVFSDYFITAWVKQDNPPQTLPMALSLEFLYQQLLGLVLPLSGKGTLEEHTETISQIRQLEKEAEKLSDCTRGMD